MVLVCLFVMTVVECFECLQYMGAINSSSLFLNLNEFESALFPRQKTNVAIKKGQQCWSIQAVKFLMHYTESTFLFRFEFLYFRISDSTFVCFHWSLMDITGRLFRVHPLRMFPFFSPSLERVFVLSFPSSFLFVFLLSSSKIDSRDEEIIEA